MSENWIAIPRFLSKRVTVTQNNRYLDFVTIRAPLIRSVQASTPIGRSIYSDEFVTEWLPPEATIRRSKRTCTMYRLAWWPNWRATILSCEERSGALRWQNAA